MRSAQILLNKTLNSFRVMDLSHKIFLLLVLFNILAWSDVFKPEPLKVTSSVAEAKLVCDTAQWSSRRLGVEYTETSRFNIVSTQPSFQNHSGQSKKLDTDLEISFLLEFKLHVAKNNYFVSSYSHNNKLRGFSLRGPPMA